MEIGDIITDALTYPFNNVMALVIYAVLGIVAAFVLVLTGVSLAAGIGANNVGISVIGIVGIIVAILLYLLVYGYGLDVIKIGIDKGDGSPEIDFVRQVTNGIKLLIVGVVYLIIPIIVMLALMYINNTLGIVVGVILTIIFAFALMMGECRLADTEDLGYALNIPEAVKDVTRVGIVKILALLVVYFIIYFVLNLIVGAIASTGDIGAYIGAIISGIVSIYLTFFLFRATGLLYSEV